MSGRSLERNNPWWGAEGLSHPWGSRDLPLPGQSEPQRAPEVSPAAGEEPWQEEPRSQG